ncbi:2-hydroxychromene-2-carboxylate isomerase [Massilia sp. PAMC28688]|uniref:2-hydroxychromene-2-carboxylate isomerase n=1 Tax=Massilia sp. PAMC28688 TaxID=2861283 RepID=UPI001C63126D|nr:2-hydroxychromene-2-carboxylate isomerase [Massilia sp. PAMC28688]QYF95570.1 2-hydroxychromene-2-carboxylate isomerase [Massilia sp. PAMC28688]
MGKTITYYLTPQSPFAYLGHARLLRIAAAHDAQIDIRPFDLGRVFSVSGGLPLAKRAPQRQAYRLQELARWSAHLGVPLNPQPKVFPVPPEPAARLIIAARTSLGVAPALELAGAVMRGLWAEDRNIADDATLAQVADLCGFDGRMLLKSAATAGVQDQFDKNTDDAIAANVFGAPWYIVDGEGYWGQDRLDFVERAVSA